MRGQHLSFTIVRCTYSHNIVDWDMLGDSNDERDFGFDCFFNGSCSLRCCDVDAGRVWLELLHGFPYGANDWKPQMLLTVFLGVRPTHNIGAPCYRLLRVGCGLLSCEALEDDASV